MEQNDFITAARDSAIEWARNILSLGSNVLILDTETTGLDFSAEIVQISMIDLDCNVVMDTLVHPLNTIPRDAIAIHGITNAMVVEAPTWDQLYPKYLELVSGKELVIYNSDYDSRIIRQSCQARGIEAIYTGKTHCAMLNYAEYVGDWNDYRGGFRWQKLQGGDHSALGDCRATLDLIKRMANASMSYES